MNNLYDIESRKKLLFVAHDYKFIDKFIEYIENSKEFYVKLDKWWGHNNHDIAYSKECLEWADIIFCEWGLGNAVWYSQNKNKYQKLIVRIHSQELRTNHYKKYNVDNIDEVICVGSYMVDKINRIMSIPKSKITMIYNYVDYECLSKDKVENYNYNLGILGICPKSKRLDLAIDIFERLWSIDTRYKLFIKGKKPNEYTWLLNNTEEKLYYKNIFDRINNSEWKTNIYFDPYSKDVENWFSKIGYILSTSDFESFHLAIGEGMASGSIPIILNWSGCEYIYPNEYIFKNVMEATSFIINNYDVNIESIKNYARDNFNKYKVFEEMKNSIYTN